MLFGPRRFSLLLALALAARAIVVLIGRLFNRLALDVGIRPRVELQSIKADALFPDRELPNVWPDRLVEFIPAHAEVAIGFAGANEARENGCDLGRASIGHRNSSPAVIGGLVSENGLSDIGFERVDLSSSSRNIRSTIFRENCSGVLYSSGCSV